MPNPKLIATPFAENGTRNDIPEAGADQPQKATMSGGWGVITQTPINEGGIPPERADFNGLGHLTTSHLAFLNRGQWYGYDANLAGQVGGYPLHARLQLDNGDIVQSTIPNNTNDPNNNMSGWKLDQGFRVVESVSDLSTSAKDGDIVYVKGYYKPTNFALSQPYIGGGERIFVESRKLENDGGEVINGWVLCNVSYVTPEMFGAVGYDGLTEHTVIEGLFDSQIQLQNAIKHPLPLVLTNCYLHSKPLVVGNNKKITGAGRDITKLLKTTHEKSGLPTLAKPTDNKMVNYDVDASIIIFNEQGDYVNGTTLEGFRISYTGTAHKPNPIDYEGYGIYAPLTCESVYSDIKCLGYEYPVYTVNSWLVKFDRVHAHGHNGFTIGGLPSQNTVANTTTNFINCWSTATGANKFAFNFNLIWQVAMTSCAAEGMGVGGASQGVINAQESYVIVSGLDIEASDIKQFIKGSFSTVLIESVNCYEVYMNGSNKGTYLYDVEWGRCEVHNSSMSFINPTATTSPNFAKLVGNVDFIYKNSYTTLDITGTATSGYSPLANDFVVYAAENSFYDVDARNGVTHTNRTMKMLAQPEIQAYTVSTTLNSMRSSKLTNAFVLPTVSDTPISGDLGYLQNYSGGNSNPTENNSIQIVYSIGGAQKVQYRSGVYGGGFGAWVNFLTSANTTTDSNGFIKAASPIVQLFSDKIQKNIEASSQNIEFKKLGVGNYMLVGSTGLSSDGWYIEIPKDANGNILVAVKYQQLDDGSIEVKTFSKKFDESTGDIVPDTNKPEDIPGGRWIDIRLN